MCRVRRASRRRICARSHSRLKEEDLREVALTPQGGGFARGRTHASRRRIFAKTHPLLATTPPPPLSSSSSPLLLFAPVPSSPSTLKLRKWSSLELRTVSINAKRRVIECVLYRMCSVSISAKRRVVTGTRNVIDVHTSIVDAKETYTSVKRDQRDLH